MKKVFKILKSLLLGSLDIFPSMNENIDHENPETGKYDFIRLGAYIIQLVLILAFITGKITIEQLKELIKSLY